MTKQTRVPKLRFPEFSEEFNSIKLSKEIDNLGYGPRFNSNDYNLTGNVKTIRGTDIGLNGEIKYSQVPLALLEEKLIQNHILEDGDLVMITTADCGLTGVFRSQEVNYIASAYAVKIKLKASSSPFFFKYYFQTELSKNQVNKFIRKATVANLPGSDVLNFKVSLPPLPEQTKIANFLTAIDDKIQGLKEKKFLLEEYKKGLMQQIFSQNLRFKQDDGSDFPDWEEKTLGEVSYRIVTKNKEGNTNVLTISAQLGLISQLEFFNKSVSAKDVTGYYLLEKEDFAYNKSYSNGYPMGAIKRLKRYDKGVVSTLYICFRFKENINLEFMDQYFESGVHNQEIEKVAQEGARNHGLLNIGLGDFFNTSFKLPSTSEQFKIAILLSCIDEKIEKVNQQIAEVESYKKGLLQQMFV
jgi:type I restriction enzyme, S subunit